MQTIHINLVSEQLLPNVMPVFADANCQGIILVQGDNTLLNKTEHLTKMYQRQGLPILWISEGTSSHRLVQLQKQANELIDRLATHHADKQWMLNATCGTKPMALAFANAFNRFNIEHPETASNGIPRALIFYTDTQNHEMPLLNEGVDYALPWKSVMNLDEILACSGFEISQQIDKSNDDEIWSRADLTRYLGKQFQGQCQKMLGNLQGMANEASQEFPLNQHQTMRSAPQDPYAAVYKRLADANLLAWDGNSQQICFQSEDACRYLAGRWLEELTYITACECGFEQVAMSVEGIWQGKAIKFNNERGKNNEFDVLICHNNQLLIIECKAKSWYERQTGESTNQDVILKLDSLGRKLGGLYGERILVSARKLPDEMVQRAKDNHISYCHLADGKTIRTTLQRYLDRM